MSEKEEIWKDVPEYEGYYQASNLGRVRSLDRTVTYSNGRKAFYKGRLVDRGLNNGYKQATLTKDNVGRTYNFSLLVAMAFLDHKPNGHTLVVDHINGDRSDDRVENLRIVTNRANISTCFRTNEDFFSSEYAGVSWNEVCSKWQAGIQYNGNKTYLGTFTDDLEASNAYQSALSKVKDGSFNPSDYKSEFTSKHKGVNFHKASGKWMAQIRINGRQKYLGCFSTELEAHQAYQSKLKELQSA